MRKKGFGLLVALVAAGVLAWLTPQPVAAASDTPLYMVYYRAWRDRLVTKTHSAITDPNVQALTDLPYGVDIVNVFLPAGQIQDDGDFLEALKTVYVPTLHERGTQVVSPLSYRGLVNDFKAAYQEQAAGTTSDPALPDYATPERIAEYAHGVVQRLVTDRGVDGLDIDAEVFSPTDEERAIVFAVVRALSTELGPKAANGTKLIWDTTVDKEEVFQPIADCFDLVAFQQYGQSVEAAQYFGEFFQSIGVPLSQFVPGLTFEEEGVADGPDVRPTLAESPAVKVAQYVQANHLGGMFMYAGDRDGRDNRTDDIDHVRASTFRMSKVLIATTKGVTLEALKAQASHFLARVQAEKGWDAAQVAALQAQIAAATDLTQVVSVFVADTASDSVAPEFDPAYEQVLMAQPEQVPAAQEDAATAGGPTGQPATETDSSQASTDQPAGNPAAQPAKRPTPKSQPLPQTGNVVSWVTVVLGLGSLITVGGLWRRVR
ncbi:EndoS/ChiA family endoglycosidase [Lacticaseibacillus daqingensis]|uniref:EndoS/ChiA family endoglycosidase n=1 Tax=Lacticaseibacillus daqingensis TaxID=2486014 RepID=UPI000F7B56C6|nr:hypothetical protein [Lacticaseibacillus daqingensis]